MSKFNNPNKYAGVDKRDIICTRKVYVGPKCYEIQAVRNLFDEGTKYSGLHYPHNQIIQVDVDYGRIFFIKTFMHEIVHAIDQLMSLGLGEKKVDILGDFLSTMLIQWGIISEEAFADFITDGQYKWGVVTEPEDEDIPDE